MMDVVGSAITTCPGGGVNPLVLIICTHLRRDRSKAVDRDFLQPLAGVHVGSCIDHDRYEVELYHEMWHGPFDTASILPGRYTLVFLTGLQQDFDRMRQLSYFFRRSGATVVAGGNICTLFPDFAARFFDSVCVGGVEAVFQVMRDHEAGTLGTVYRGPRQGAGSFPLAYHLLTKAGIDVPLHLVEASRGCRFTCTFCILPAEQNRYLSYGAPSVSQAIESSVASSPRWSLRRRFPMVWFMDNNFSDNPRVLAELCRVLSGHKRVRAWGALITQNVLRDRDAIRMMARSKCRALFVGIESFDREFLKRTRKRQNLSKAQSVEDDVAFAERCGISVVYSQLVDPRTALPATVEADLRAIAQGGVLPLPCFISFVSPLVGTEMFWDCVAEGDLRPGLRLREMDGETIAFNTSVVPEAELVRFARVAFTQTWRLVPRRLVLWNVIRRMSRARCLSPFQWVVALQCSWRVMAKSSEYSTTAGRNYLGGQERLDTQYREYPADIGADDLKRYFEPVLLTEADGRVADWLLPYHPSRSRQPVPANMEQPDGLPGLP